MLLTGIDPPPGKVAQEAARLFWAGREDEAR
jgi:hypothetical protein